MTSELVQLQTVATFDPPWVHHDLPGNTQVVWANEEALTADALTLTTESAVLGDCLDGHLHFIDGDVLVAGNFAALQAGHCMQAKLAHGLGFCPDRMIVLRADATRLAGRFLLYFLRQRRMQNLIAVHLQGNKRQFPHPREFLRTLKIPLPALAAQQQWCRQLDHAFAQQRKWQLEARSRDTTRRLAFLNFFGSTGTMKERWPTVQLQQVLDKLLLGSANLARYHAPKGDVLMQPCNLGSNRINLVDVMHIQLPAHGVRRSKVLEGDVLLSMPASHLGKTAVAPVDIGLVYAGKGVAILRSKKIEPGFLAAFLNSGTGMGEIELALQALPGYDLTADAIRGLNLPLPPRARQQEFVLADHDLEADCNDAWARLMQAQTRFAQIEHEAFRG